MKKERTTKWLTRFSRFAVGAFAMALLMLTSIDTYAYRYLRLTLQSGVSTNAIYIGEIDWKVG